MINTTNEFIKITQRHYLILNDLIYSAAEIDK